MACDPAIWHRPYCSCNTHFPSPGNGWLWPVARDAFICALREATDVSGLKNTRAASRTYKSRSQFRGKFHTVAKRTRQGRLHIGQARGHTRASARAGGRNRRREHAGAGLLSFRSPCYVDRLEAPSGRFAPRPLPSKQRQPPANAGLEKQRCGAPISIYALKRTIL